MSESDYMCPWSTKASGVFEEIASNILYGSK